MENEEPKSINIFAVETLQAIDTAAITTSAVTVTAISPSIEQELVFPADMPREELSANLRHELEPNFKITMIEKMVEIVENKGLSLKDIELGVTLEEGFKFKISWGRRKIIRSFFKVKGEE